ncbi:MAG: hypothetical protein VKS61_01780, partial [Candidatus Sericytochromatia bacterium]|nr:hypothetical protein [Candidatus Sericytochromatia bacterium]
SYKELVELFKRFKCSQIDDGRRIYWQRMKLDDAQTAVLEKLNIVIPPTSWETWIEVERRAAKSRKKGPSSRKGTSR